MREEKEAKRLERIQGEEERRLHTLTEMEESFMKQRLEEKPLEIVEGLVKIMGTLEDTIVVKELRELKPPNYPPTRPLPPVAALSATSIVFPAGGNIAGGMNSQQPRHVTRHFTFPHRPSGQGGKQVVGVDLHII